MTIPFENMSVVDQNRQLDRLVDGELSHDEQRQLILALEAQSDGWRRCALAFLESQAWDSELQPLTAAPAAATLAPLTQPASPGAFSKMPTWLVTAAGLILAFTLGVLARGPSSTSETQVASAPVNGKNTETISEGTPIKQTDSIGSRASVPADAKLETVKISIPSTEGSPDQTVELPVIEADQESLASMLTDEKPVLSDLELKTLESTGHQVEQRRAYYPVQLQDGRRAVLPMDLVEVKYTGGWQ